MATKAEAMVERVARAMFEARHLGSVWDNETNSLQESYRVDARAAIEALSTPEFVLPLAEQMMADVAYVEYSAACKTLLDSYRAAKGE